MKRTLAVSIFCVSLCFVGLAQQNAADAPATQADVQKYLDAVHAREMTAQMVQAIAGPLHQMIHDEFAKDADKLPPDFEQRMTKMLDDMMANMPWDEMMQAMLPAYEKHFTKGEMDALTAFYSSPVGQKILRELPAVTAESMQTMMPIMRKYVDDVTERMKGQMAQMHKESGKAAGKQN